MLIEHSNPHGKLMELRSQIELTHIHGGSGFMSGRSAVASCLADRRRRLRVWPVGEGSRAELMLRDGVDS
jgi:tagatose-1,6-bisphosphate aldolase